MEAIGRKVLMLHIGTHGALDRAQKLWSHGNGELSAAEHRLSRRFLSSGWTPR